VHAFLYNSTTSKYEPLGNVLIGDQAASYSGSALALSQNGRRMAVAAPFYSGYAPLHGQVTVYELSEDNLNWNMMGQAVSGNGELDLLGSAVALSRDGMELAASAPRSKSTGAGYARVWFWDEIGQNWNVSAADITNTYGPSLSSDRFGHSISLYSRAAEELATGGGGGVVAKRPAKRLLAIGIPWKTVNEKSRAGMTIVFELSPSSSKSSQTGAVAWKQLGPAIVQETPTMDEEAGTAVALLDESHLLVGTPGANSRQGSVQLYRFLPSSSSTATTATTNGGEDSTTSGAWQMHPIVLQGSSVGDNFGVSLAGSRSRSSNNAKEDEEVDKWSLVVGGLSGSTNAGHVDSYYSVLNGTSSLNN
jgi:hypothetical protein